MSLAAGVRLVVPRQGRRECPYQSETGATEDAVLGASSAALLARQAFRQALLVRIGPWLAAVLARPAVVARAPLALELALRLTAPVLAAPPVRSAAPVASRTFHTDIVGRVVPGV